MLVIYIVPYPRGSNCAKGRDKALTASASVFSLKGRKLQTEGRKLKRFQRQFMADMLDRYVKVGEKTFWKGRSLTETWISICHPERPDQGMLGKRE